MASQQENVDFICEQMAGAGAVSARRMFGEYGIYCDGVFIGVICDDRLHLKPTDALVGAAPDLEMAPAYPGAKPSAVIPAEVIEDADRLAELASLTRDNLPTKKR